MNRFLETNTLLCDNDNVMDEPSGTTAAMKSNTAVQLSADAQASRIRELERENEALYDRQLKLENSLEILTERFETLRIINERLQTKNLTLEKQYEELSKITRITVEETSIKVTPPEKTSTPMKLHESEISDTISSVLDEDVEPESSAKRKLTFSPPGMNKKLCSLYSETKKSDSGIEDEDRGIPPVSLSLKEVDMFTRNLIKKKSDKKSENDDDLKDDKIDDNFSNFGSKESVTNDDGVTTTYIWLNKNFKILYEDWKVLLKAKDERKFVKSLLRIMHSKDGSYERALSTRCVSNKVCFTPQGRNRRNPLNSLELMTIQKCMKYYCKKIAKMDEGKMNIALSKANAIVTEEINTCIKNQKKLFNNDQASQN